MRNREKVSGRMSERKKNDAITEPFYLEETSFR